jgi:hypothetical protein
MGKMQGESCNMCVGDQAVDVVRTALLEAGCMHMHACRCLQQDSLQMFSCDAQVLSTRCDTYQGCWTSSPACLRVPLQQHTKLSLDSFNVLFVR